MKWPVERINSSSLLLKAITGRQMAVLPVINLHYY